MRAAYPIVVIAAAVAVVALGAPSWAALAAGLAIALASGVAPPPIARPLTAFALQAGVVALGAGMNLVVVWHVGSSGALLTAASLAIAIGLGLGLGRALRIGGDLPLLISVGTAICGGSAIAAVASVIRPRAQDMSISLAVVFVLNAVALVAFPLIGHALGLSESVFGRWAALGIHDTSSVVGAGLAYGPHALEIATTTKLARALWIVPVTLVIAIVRGGRSDDDGDGDRSQLAGIKPAGVMVAGVTPAGVMPAGVTSAGVTSAGVTPAGVMPAGVMSAGVMSAGVMPAGVMPAGVTPTGVTPAGVTSADVTPADVTPSGVMAAGVMPADITRADVTSADGTSADGTSVASASLGHRLVRIRWPWFILGFVAVAALVTWLPAVAPVAPYVVRAGQRLLLLALFLIGLGLSREALARVGARPLVLGVALWAAVAGAALELASVTTAG